MSDMLNRFAKFTTPTVSDALDRLGIEGACLGIKPLDRSFHVLGHAFTLKYEATGISSKGTVGDYIDDVEPGKVIVIDNAGRLDCTVWGDILTTVSSMKKIGGTVIDGVCRDTGHILQLDYPVFSRDSYMRTGKDRVQLEAVNVPVTISNIRVNPGDIIFGDSDGVLIIPQEKAEDVLEVADHIEQAESQIIDAIQNGMRLDEARKKFKYHQLQTKEL
ncbi:RraA family protein [Bacillus sp. MUM 13]|uniref:RraA family protein n=1 Tax=Bacillus sp. MUM 13 TaxID=1678001 RepID=UPI0008F5D518|nr:RraA family protein [Bacillus sp. MUM 13]OIK11941.1 diguanylate cyclase [Bacillus sp. MUM 13]